MKRVVLIFLGLIVSVYGIACVLLYRYQDKLIYHPQPQVTVGPADQMVLDHTDDELDKDVRVMITVRPHDGSKAMLYFGGNAEDASSNLVSFSKAFPDYALFLMNYRGYGGSTGKPGEEALVRDALALFDRVHAKYDKVSVVGRSLGSAVAVRLASVRPVKHLVLVTPFHSLADITQANFALLPVSWLLRDRYDSHLFAYQVTAPTQILMAEHDALIPQASTRKLFSSFDDGIATLQVVRGVDHNSIATSPRYVTLIREGI